VGVVKRVEDVEELFLRAVLARDELDVVHEEHVDRAVFVPEGGQSVEADGVDHLVDEPVGRDVQQVEAAAVPGLDVVPDGVHEVGLAQAHSAIEEERVVALGRDLGHGPRGGMGELVGRADHEALEGVLRIEDGEGGRLPVRGGRRLRDRPRLRIAVEEDVHLSAAELVEGFRDDALIVLGQPVLELSVRDADVERGSLETKGGRRTEPRREAVTVDFGLHLGENVVPEVHGRPQGGTRATGGPPASGLEI
jgi:hypothetical protein